MPAWSPILVQKVEIQALNLSIRKLKAETGRGLRQVRDAIRLERANQSLRADRTVAEAAHSAGFSDPAYFSRWFRKKTGSTPSAFRRG